MAFTFYEFFAGGGMARAGLGDAWSCLFANDVDPQKGAAYAANWGAEHVKIADVAALTTADLPGVADAAWASFPCQDLSLAGLGAGLRGERSGSFRPFWRLIEALKAEGRMPGVVILENVCGALTSHKGQDFIEICTALANGGYRFGACVVDAVHFVPQSRPRLFVIGVREDAGIPPCLMRTEPDSFWHTKRLISAYEHFPSLLKERWIWWKLPRPQPREALFADVMETHPQGVVWHTAAETQRLLALMSSFNLQKVKAAKREKRRIIGCVYKRTRVDVDGRRVQRAEIRFDDVAGCLRTPAGGSSRQTIVVIEGGKVRSRLLSAREGARLMGLSDGYALPLKYNDAYRLVGDGLAVPVVRFLASSLAEPLIACAPSFGRLS